MVGMRCCTRCQAEVSADAPDGLCPECLLRHVIDGRSEEPEGGTAQWSPAPSFVPPAPAELGRHFPQLEVLELLGQGGMGAVYKARQTKLDRLVAIKVLPPEVARDPAFAERFLREARSLARLNHPNIVTVHDFGDAGGLYHFTMEYVDGRNLRDLLQSGPLPAAQALEIAAQICDALQYAHDEGLIHRDIKPENVLLDRKGHVTIADFGLAKLVGLTPAYLTLTGTQEVMGTLLYMAPEQMKQARTVDHRADIYSLGVVLYEMLTGELPLGRFAPPSHKAAVGERLDQVVLRALAREPAERYQDARAFKQDVQAALAAPGAGGLPGAAPSRRAWPSAGFQMLSPREGNSVVARGLVSRDDEALILDFESAKRKYESFFKEPGLPQDVRIPLPQIASLSYGWGWGKPPRSLILKVTRLSTLAGMPGNWQGRAHFSILREDRDQARALVESIMGPASVDPKQGSAGSLSSALEARQIVKMPAVGLLATGVLDVLWWAVFGMTMMPFRQPDFWLRVLTLGLLLASSASVRIGGAVAMLRVRGYPWAGAAAIFAVIPWSPSWVLGLPFGIWAIIILGKPQVTEAFFGDKRQAESRPAHEWFPRIGIASRFLSMFRSCVGYVLWTMPGRNTTTGDWSGESPQPNVNLVPRPGASDSGEGP